MLIIIINRLFYFIFIISQSKKSTVLEIKLAINFFFDLQNRLTSSLVALALIVSVV